MNILLISPLPPPRGGMAGWTYNYLESKKAAENTVITVNTAVLGKRIKQYGKLNLWDETKRTYLIISKIKRMLKQYEFDVVHLSCSLGRFGLARDYLSAVTVKRFKKRLITQFHCDISCLAGSGPRLYLLRKLVRVSDGILVLNDASRDYIYRFCSGRKADIISNFLSDRYLESITSKKTSFDEGIKVVLYVGHIEKRKGSKVIYEIAKRMPKVDFILLGSQGPDVDIKAPRNVHLLGEVAKERVLGEMHTADVFLFPSWEEGFPLVILEAMACGLPIIATPVGAIPKMINEEGAILIPIDDADAAERAVLSLSSGEKRRRMANANRERFKACYTEEKVMEEIFRLYAKGYEVGDLRV